MAIKRNFPGRKATVDPQASVRRRASSICLLDGNKVLMVRLRDPESGVERLFPPGGLIESGETAADAAVRETLEETGYVVQAADLPPVIAHYDFLWANKLYRCETAFVICKILDPKLAPQLTHEPDFNRGTVWLPVDQVAAELEFHLEIQCAVGKSLEVALRKSEDGISGTSPELRKR